MCQWLKGEEGNAGCVSVAQRLRFREVEPWFERNTYGMAGEEASVECYEVVELTNGLMYGG